MTLNEIATENIFNGWLDADDAAAVAVAAWWCKKGKNSGKPFCIERNALTVYVSEREQTKKKWFVTDAAARLCFIWYNLIWWIWKHDGNWKSLWYFFEAFEQSTCGYLVHESIFRLD